MMKQHMLITPYPVWDIRNPDVAFYLEFRYNASEVNRMEIHEELLCRDIGRYILSHLQVLPFQAADVESKAISLLRDIQAVIQDMEAEKS